MPSLEIHCAQSQERYGKPFTKLHKWMDALVKALGSKHRKYRHNIKITPSKAKKLFGKFADDACIDHILLDWNGREIKKFKSLTIVKASPIYLIIPKL